MTALMAMNCTSVIAFIPANTFDRNKGRGIMGAGTRRSTSMKVTTIATAKPNDAITIASSKPL